MDQDQLRARCWSRCARAPSMSMPRIDRVRHLPFEDLGFAKVDHHRALRHGMPEVIFGKGKTPEQVFGHRSATCSPVAQNVLITRADAATAATAAAKRMPGAEYFPLSGAIRFWRDRTLRGKGKIAVVCAGTSDLPVAEEAQVTAEVMGNQVESIHDIGVAGIHRLMQTSRRLTEATRGDRLRRHGRRAAERGRRTGRLPR